MTVNPSYFRFRSLHRRPDNTLRVRGRIYDACGDNRPRTASIIEHCCPYRHYCRPRNHTKTIPKPYQNDLRASPGDPRDPPENHPGPPRAALGPPSSPLGGHGVAQTAKSMILLKLSLILMNFQGRGVQVRRQSELPWCPPRAVGSRFGGKVFTPYNTVLYRSNVF